MTWTQVTSSASFSPRVGHGCAVVGTQVVLMDGYWYYGAGYLNDLWVSTDMGSSWTNKTSGNFTARRDFGIAAFLGKLWVIGGGGAGSKIYGDVWYSNGTTLSNWTLANGSAFPIPRYDMGATVFNNRMWVAAGYIGNTCLNDVLR